MPLRARVGRHTRDGGRHCQNWPDDQQTVINLLNRIPIADGGSAGKLANHVISGICSDELYRAISSFEDKHFPGQRRGYVDPAGAMLKRMEDLAAAAAPAPGSINFVTPVEMYGLPTGPTSVISSTTHPNGKGYPLASGHVLFAGIVGDSNKVVKTVSADIPNAVTIENAGVAGSGIHWFRLSVVRQADPPREVMIQAKDAKGAVVASFGLGIIDLPKMSVSTDFTVDPADPKHPNRIVLRVYAPKDDADNIDTRMTGVGYEIFLKNGFEVYCTGLNLPIDVPDSLVDLNASKAEPIDAKVYDTLSQANEAIRRAPPKAKGVMPFAYYRGAGGAVIAPTIFSAATTPRIIATLWVARELYVDYVQSSLTGLAIGMVGGAVLRKSLGRIFRAPKDPKAPRGPFSPIPRGRIRPVNDTVNVGGGGEIPNVTNLNPVKPGSGGPTSGIPNHVPGGMEDMDALFTPGSVKNMYSQRLRYVDVDWQRATQAAAKVMPPGGKVSMNIWTQNQQEVAALKTAFEGAGFKKLRIWGVSPGPGTMLDAVR